MLLVLTMLACKSETKNTTTAQQEPGAQAQIHPMLPAELQNKLYNQVDFLDFIFHNFPFSMSQKEKPSIQLNISYIDKKPVLEIPAGCKPVARQFYQIEGEIILEADVYFGEGCSFYVFFENGQAKYANQMSPDGIGFFNNVISQAINASKQIRQ